MSIMGGQHSNEPGGDPSWLGGRDRSAGRGGGLGEGADGRDAGSADDRPDAFSGAADGFSSDFGPTARGAAGSSDVAASSDMAEVPRYDGPQFGSQRDDPGAPGGVTDERGRPLDAAGFAPAFGQSSTRGHGPDPTKLGRSLLTSFIPLLVIGGFVVMNLVQGERVSWIFLIAGVMILGQTIVRLARLFGGR
ncbi:hypothetical protein V1260_04930 [Brachybacterium sp. J144]|uniref:hypothetical protein n=1 Tax=Brachybacterium sp. J144 TaxID=3116487 RepID=UPI002E783E4C|nr:hypothetical protein [Brachybacterium sp. J144]MEE1650129.1 hypothetical protein [Brachybacterium sp. J144]